jgi:hypothetical protein
VFVFVVADDHGQGEPRLDDNAQRGQRFALQAVMASSTRARRVALRGCHDPAVGYEWLSTDPLILICSSRLRPTGGR